MTSSEPGIAEVTEKKSAPDSTRLANLAHLLRIVHWKGPVTRALLTRDTGLNRSTIAGLVGELVEKGLVVETDPQESAGVGRPSLVVQASPNVLAVAVNPEIDAVTVGIVDFSGVIRKRVRYATERVPSAREVVNIAAAIIEGMRGDLEQNDNRVLGVGIAVPGLVRLKDGLVQYAPHLQWHQEPIAEMMREATGYPSYAANDANLGAQAEHLFGEGRGVEHLVYLNGGPSGIGGGIIVNGVLLNGVDGYAGEFGHNIVAGAVGSGQSGAVAEFEHEVSMTRLLTALGREALSLDELEHELTVSKTPQVLAEIDRQCGFIVTAVRNIVHILNPQVVALGGFLGILFDLKAEQIQAQLGEAALMAPMQNVRIARAGLKSNLLMVGSGEMVFKELLDNPALEFGGIRTP